MKDNNDKSIWDSDNMKSIISRMEAKGINNAERVLKVTAFIVCGAIGVAISKSQSKKDEYVDMTKSLVKSAYKKPSAKSDKSSKPNRSRI